MSLAKTPNLFLVGVQRSATTALWSYLGEHPDIFMASPKEMHFFGSDLGALPGTGDSGTRVTLDEYLDSFAPARIQRYLGDASVGYLPSLKAAAEIREFCPDARIIASFRDPVDMLYSLWSLLRFQGVETTRTFVEALDDGEPRWALTAGSFRWAFIYRNLIRYAEQLERFLDAFGAERVHVVIYEDFVSDIARSYGDVLTFLGVDTAFQPEFSVVNANRKVRSTRLRELVERPSTVARRIGRLVVPVQSLRGVLGKHVVSYNEPTVDRHALDPAVRAQLDAEFAGEVARLQKLIGRDLSGRWSRSTTPSAP